MIPPLSKIHPITGKKLNAFFLVCSPKQWEPEVHRRIIDRICEPGFSYLSTHEWGADKNHHHANYIYYSSSRDTNDESKRLFRFDKAFKKPLIKTKKVTNMANAINYITKEVCH